MKRTVAKIAFVGAFFIAALGLIIVVRELWFPGLWMGGIGSVFGTIVVTTTPKLFDRIWPKPMEGWAE